MSNQVCIQTVNIFGEPLPRAFWACAGDSHHSDHDEHRSICGGTPYDRTRCEAHEPKYAVSGNAELEDTQ